MTDSEIVAAVKLAIQQSIEDYNEIDKDEVYKDVITAHPEIDRERLNLIFAKLVEDADYELDRAERYAEMFAEWSGAGCKVN